jgi:hypothetical protein
MDTFNNNSASGNDMMAGTEQDIFSNEQIDYAPELDTAQQTEYSGLQDFDFEKYLDDDKTSKEVQTEPAQSAPESFIDPSLVNLSNAAQQPNDASNSGIYNDMSMLDPKQGIYNAGGLFVDNASYQPNIVHPFQYQQNQVKDNLLQTNLLQQQLLARQIEQKQIQAGELIQNPFGMNSIQQMPLEQDVFPQSPYFQQILNSDLQAPQPTSAVQPGFLKQEIQTAKNLDSPAISYQGEGQVYVYRNEILNNFEEPAVVLQIIDQLEYPFAAHLQGTLKKELSRLEDLKTAKLLELATETETKPKAGRKKNNNSSKISKTPAKVPKNKRKENGEKVLAIAAKTYKDIPTKPASWGPINPDTGRPTFEYTKYGELMLGQTFTTSQISDYLAYHPIHGVLPNGSPDTKDSGLKLWVQYAGADSNARYPSPDKSNKCRFTNCPRASHAIQKGEPRICLDEQRFPDFPTNPFHNAGYVHLYCFEKEFDFPDLCKNFNIAPDARVFAKGDMNRCAITKDHPEMEKLVNNFICESKPWEEFNAEGTRPADWYPESLSSQVVEYHLAHQPKTAQTARDKRGGNSIDIYKGDLDLWLRLDVVRKAKNALNPKPKGQKRKLENVNEDEDEDAEGSDEDVLDEEIVERPIKRARRS